MNESLKKILRPLYPVLSPLHTAIHKNILTPYNIKKNEKKANRMLDIGPGKIKIEKFESLNIIAGLKIDYVLDASKPLPFKSNSFDLIHASHILEHIPWHQINDVVQEWHRLLKPNGRLELWVPDGYKLCRLLCDIEEGTDNKIWQDEWNPRQLITDAFTWTNGRLLYGIRNDYPSWHKSILTPSYLKKILSNAGFENIRFLDESEIRGHNHGWINLGIQGEK